MGKKEKHQTRHQQKTVMSSKTLRAKLRKKREQLKLQQKSKNSQHQSQKPCHSNNQCSRIKQTQQSFASQIQQKKVHKYINKFMDIYQDDLQEFYDMFKTFDDLGSIDISEIESKALKKCLKKLFKHLPLKKENNGYKKDSQASINLQKYIKNIVNDSMNHYLQHGSNQSQQNQSSEEQNKHNKQQKQQHKPLEAENLQPLRPELETVLETGPSLMGPYIPSGERQKMARMFQEQLEEIKQNKSLIAQQEQAEFNQILMGKTRKQMKTVIPDSNQSVPEHLMAKGSALIGQKVQINEEQIEEFNKINRPKKLIEMHKEIMKQRGQDPKVRKPFSRERDILGEGTKSYMSNSTFFDFKNRMSKPKSTNQFL